MVNKSIDINNIQGAFLWLFSEHFILFCHEIVTETKHNNLHCIFHSEELIIN